MSLVKKLRFLGLTTAGALTVAAVMAYFTQLNIRTDEEAIVPLARPRLGIYTEHFWSPHLIVRVMNPSGVRRTSGTYELQFNDRCAVVGGGVLRAVAHRGSQVLVILDEPGHWPGPDFTPACLPTTMFWLDESTFRKAEQEHRNVSAYREEMGRERERMRSLESAAGS